MKIISSSDEDFYRRKFLIRNFFRKYFFLITNILTDKYFFSRLDIHFFNKNLIALETRLRVFNLFKEKIKEE